MLLRPALNSGFWILLLEWTAAAVEDTHSTEGLTDISSNIREIVWWLLCLTVVLLIMMLHLLHNKQSLTI